MARSLLFVLVLVAAPFPPRVGALRGDDPPGQYVDKDQLKPKYGDLKIFTIGDDFMKGTLSFEKAQFEFTDQMNGYGAFLAHSCDQIVVLLDAQSDMQNPNQSPDSDKIVEEESAVDEEKKDEARPPKPQLKPWSPLPDQLIPVGWREQWENIRTPSMVDSALSGDVTPFLRFTKSPIVPKYEETFSISLPSAANVIALYGGMYIPDPKHAADVSAGLAKATDKPKTIFVPLSNPVVFPIRKAKENSLYLSPLSAKFEGKVEDAMVTGVLTFAGAFYENYVPNYAILFGTGPHANQRIGTEFSFIRGLRAMPRLPDGRYQVQFDHVQLAPHATHILVFGGHPHNCNKPAAVDLFPAPPVLQNDTSVVAPDSTTPTDLKFMSTGAVDGKLTGVLQFSRAVDDDDFLGYVVQFAANTTKDSRVPLYGGNPLTDFNVKTLFKDPNSDLFREDFNQVDVPRFAQYLRVSGFSRYNASADPRSAALPWGTPAFVPIAGGFGTH